MARRGPKPKPLAERFHEKWASEPGTGCWRWTAMVSRYGYGRIGAGGKRGPTLWAHRVSYELHVGPIPAGMCVCHRCDNPSCVNPDHLFLGTHGDNVADKVDKRRHPHGEKHSSARATEDVVRAIRRRVADGEPQARLCEEFGLHPVTVSKIARRSSWKHVQDDAPEKHGHGKE